MPGAAMARPAGAETAAAGERAGPVVLVAIVLLAINLRTVLASLSPLVADVRADLGLSAAAAGLLTTLPILCLGAFAPLAPRLAGRVPIERLLVALAVATAAGAGLRGAGTTAALVAGGLVAGTAIALAQAIVPALVRARFPGQAGMLTGAFSLALALGAAAGAGAAVPLERALGGEWRASLAAWAAPALLAALVWLPWALRPGTVIAPGGGAALRRVPLAWSVSVFFGVQSMAFYAALSWLPSILEDAGRSAEAAGGLLALSTLMQLAPALLVPMLAVRLADQLPLLAAMVAIGVAGLLGLLAAPGLAPLWVVLLGLSHGGSLGLGLILPQLRGGDARTVASLTAMTLTVGYLVAATGPWLLGAVHDATGNWTAPLLVLIAITLFELVPGRPAARERTIAC